MTAARLAHARRDVRRTSERIADATGSMSYELVLEFAKLLIGPSATLSDE